MPSKFTHEDLVIRAVRWLRNYHKCPIVYADMATSAMERPDAIGWHKGFSRVVECKVSRSDFQKDLKTKMGARYENCGMGGQRWYLTPPGLVRSEEVPAWCGLAYAHPKKIQIVKPAVEREFLDFRGEVQMLTSALRRIELGSRFDSARARWEPYPDRITRQRQENLNYIEILESDSSFSLEPSDLVKED